MWRAFTVRVLLTLSVATPLCAAVPPELRQTANGTARASNCASQDFECMRTTPVNAQGFSFNSVGQGNPGGLFCKMQLPGPSERSGKGAFAGVPNILKLNRVAAGVGVSNYQFKDSTIKLPDGSSFKAAAGQLACGMCLKATVTDSAGFDNANCELTALDLNAHTKELTFMILDQCKDPKTCCRDSKSCSEDADYGSWLDIDIYGKANVLKFESYTWEAVECPVGDDIKITLAFNQYASVNKQAVWPWDVRVPVKAMEYKCKAAASSSYTSLQWQDSLGYVLWTSECKTGDLMVYRITSIYGDQVEYALTAALPEVTHGKQGYQYLRETTVQFPSQHDAGTPALYPQQPTNGKACNGSPPAPPAPPAPPSPPSPPAPPAPPSPLPPLSGHCCNGGCSGSCQGGWCGHSQANCEGSCSGKWCPAESDVVV